jgi:serine/threonine-protein kinase RsbW
MGKYYTMRLQLLPGTGMLDHQVLLRLPSELGYEKVAMASAAVVAGRMGFPNDRIEDIKTAVAEACINAIEHGNELDVKIPVVIELNEAHNKLEIKVSDVGRKLIPLPLPSAGSSPGHRGWGMFLIQNLVDEFDFGLTPQGGNYIRMRLHLAPSCLPA